MSDVYSFWRSTRPASFWRRNWKELPSDLCADIFLRLSVTDLLSLKSVCKTFRQVISSDNFARMHLKDFSKYPKSPTRAFITSTDPTASILSYDPEKRSIGFCQDESKFDSRCGRRHDGTGPSCCRRHRVMDSYFGYLLVQMCDRLCLCNPIIGSYYFLPSTNDFSLDFGCWKIAYDDVSEQYKVFGLRVWRDRVCCLYVSDARRDGDFHLPRKTTTAMEFVGSDEKFNLIQGSVLVNGNVYWLVTAKLESGQWGCIIVSANVTTEEVKTRSCSYNTHFPFVITPGYDNFLAANGTFYLSRSFRLNQHDYVLELWVLEGVEIENPNPTWKMKERIFLTSIPRYPYFKICVLGMFRDKLLFKKLPSEQYYQYDLSSKECDKVTLVRGDDINKLQLIWYDYNQCEVYVRPVEVATRVPVGFIPSAIL